MARKPKEKKQIPYKYLPEKLREGLTQHAPRVFGDFGEFERGSYAIYVFGRRIVAYGKHMWASERGAKDSLCNHLRYHTHTLVKELMEDEQYYFARLDNDDTRAWDKRKLVRKEVRQFVEELVEKGIVEIKQL